MKILVKNMKNGITYPVGDINKLEKAIKYLIENKAKREEFGSKSKKIIEDKFNWKKISKKILNYLA